ncbi:hypothetical protein ACJIZ3_001138 [Penstemon smallii]|uniref:Cystatin domain-containing protein n=1 Tax=Penstemon smallii TaxID=265156 RepID=A0ABD3U400_9LAMI
MGSAKSLVIFALFISTFAAAAFGATPEGWWPIKNLNDPEVVGIAKFAVAEYNRTSNKALVLVSVVKGEAKQAFDPSETIYHLDIYAKDAAASTKPAGKYVTFVGDIPSKKFRGLISFYQISN